PAGPGRIHMTTATRRVTSPRTIAGDCNIMPTTVSWRGGRMADDRLENGMAMRKRVLGADHVARSQANATEFDADFQKFITDNVWGSVWMSPGLDIKSRHILTIGMLA